MNNKLISLTVMFLLLIPVIMAEEHLEPPEQEIEGCKKADLKWFDFWNKFLCGWWESMNVWLTKLVGDTLEPLLTWDVNPKGAEPLYNYIAGIAWVGVTLMFVYAGYLYAFAGSLGGIAEDTMKKAKQQIINAFIFGFALLVSPFLISFLMTDVVSSMVGGIISVSGSGTAFGTILSSIILYFIITSEAFPVTWTFGIGILLLFFGALILRVIILAFFFTIMPLILFLYLWIPTRAIGVSLIRSTLINIFFPVIWALILVLPSAIALGGTFGGFVLSFIVSLFSILTLAICGYVYIKWAWPSLPMIFSAVGAAKAIGLKTAGVAKQFGKTKAYATVREGTKGVKTPASWKYAGGKTVIPPMKATWLPDTGDKAMTRLRETHGDNLKHLKSHELIGEYNVINKQVQEEEKFRKTPMHYEVAEALAVSEKATGLVPHLDKQAKKELRNEFGRAWQLKSESEQAALIKHKRESYLSGHKVTRRGRKTVFNYTTDALLNLKDSKETNSRLQRIRDSGKSNEYLNYVVKMHPKISKGVRTLNKGYNSRISEDHEIDFIAEGKSQLKEVPTKEFVKSLEGFDHFDRTGELLKHYGTKQKIQKRKSRR